MLLGLKSTMSMGRFASGRNFEYLYNIAHSLTLVKHENYSLQRDYIVKLILDSY